MNTMINFIVTYIIWSIRSPKGFSESSDENVNECFSILQVFVLNQVEGTAELRLKEALNCEEKKSYQFDIQALSCTGSYSER